MKFLSEFLLYTQCYKFKKNNQFLTVLFIIRQNFIEFYWHKNQILNFFCEVFFNWYRVVIETGLQYTNIHSCSDQVLANRVHLLLIVLPHLLTFSIHFIHCSEIIDVIQQNCGFDNCRQEITRIGLPWTSKTFCHTDMYLWMPMSPFYLYRYLHSINIWKVHPLWIQTNQYIHPCYQRC